VAVGVGLVTVGVVMDYATWASTSPAHRSHLFAGIGFDVGVVVLALGVLFLGSLLPPFWQPRFTIECGNGNLYDRRTTPKAADKEHFPGVPIALFEKVVCVKESRGRWAENVTAEVVSVTPPHSQGFRRECLPWVSASDPAPEFEKFVPGRERWFVLHRNILNTQTNTFHPNSLADIGDEEDVRVVIVWEGKTMTAIDLHLKGINSPQPFPVATDKGHPSKREIRRSIKHPGQ